MKFFGKPGRGSTFTINQAVSYLGYRLEVAKITSLNKWTMRREVYHEFMIQVPMSKNPRMNGHVVVDSTSHKTARNAKFHGKQACKTMDNMLWQDRVARSIKHKHYQHIWAP